MRTASTASHRHRKLQLALLGTLPVLALVLPETALAATASNTASLTLPAGVTDPDLTNNTVTDTDTVLSAVVPTTESGTVAAGATATAITDVRTNDTINGVTATSSNSTITQSGSWPTGITLNPTTGAVSVSGTVAPGTYTVTYQLCDLATPTATCNTVTDTVTVNASVVPNTESGTGLALTASTPITDVRANDTINGVTATSSNSTIATDPANPLPAGFSLNTTTGAISVDNTVTAGTYSVWYELCDKTTPTAICATVKDTVTISNRQADLVLAKSNGATSVTSGQTTTYTLTVTNNGPDSVTGVVVQDTPGAGLTCPTTNPLSFGGTGGIPSGSFTVANLTGSGVTLGTLGNGQNVTITYSCTVN